MKSVPIDWSAGAFAGLGTSRQGCRHGSDRGRPHPCLRLLHFFQRLVSWAAPTTAPTTVTATALLTSSGRTIPGPSWSSRDFHKVENLCDQGQLDSALDVLLSMDTVPLVAMYRSFLKACSIKKSLAHAKRVQAHLAEHGLEFTGFLGETLVITLVKCGGLVDALQVFHRLPQRTVFSWTAVISGYTMSGQAREALRTYQWMQEDGVEPNSYTFISLLKACGSIPDLEEGKRIHFEAVKYGCISNLLVGTAVLDMYAKCRSTVDAQNVFNELSERDVVSWNAILSAYASSGEVEMALQLYEQMLGAGISPEVRTFVSMLQAFGVAGEEADHFEDGRLTSLSLQKGKVIHFEAWMRGYESNVFLGNTLVRFYSRCGSILDAQNVFDGLSQQNVVSWNAMLAAYMQQSQPEKALELYEKMLRWGVSPDSWTFVGPVQACGMLAEEEDLLDVHIRKFKCLAMGKAIHANAWRKGFESDNFVCNSLVSMYGKVRSLPDAQVVFGGLPQRNVVSWTAMLAAYAHDGQGQKGFELYEQMLEERVSPNSQTFVAALQACSMLDEQDAQVVDSQLIKVKILENSKELHAHAWRIGYQNNVFICNTLISLYGKCGSAVDAQTVFDGLVERNVVAWNAMLAAYVHQGQAEKVWELYKEMLKGSESPNDATYLCLLQICSNVGRLDICKEIHHKLLVTGHISLSLASSLIHSYARCACMEGAENVFESLANPDVVAWTALIAGYAQQGNCTASFHCYDKLRAAGVKPDGLTFLALISACSHSGLVDRGVGYFTSMSKDHGVTPEIEHYISIVDLLGRAGCFRNLEIFLSTMPVQPNLSIWLCVLGACRKHHNVALGRTAFDSAVRLQPSNGAAYVLMSNIYAHAGVWECVQKVNALRQASSAEEKPSRSWMHTGHHAHTFLVGDLNHEQQRQVFDLLGNVGLIFKEEQRTQHSTLKVFETSYK